MVRYRRDQAAGGSFFFTVALRNRRAATLVEHIDLLRNAFRETRRLRPFTVDAIVVLPEHLHAVWTLPADDGDYSGRWRAIKSRFVRLLRRRGVDVSSNPRHEVDVWQPRFWEHQIRDEGDFARHVDYVHINPVTHGWVARAAAWRWSSIHGFIRRGWISADWAVDKDEGGAFGE